MSRAPGLVEQHRLTVRQARAGAVQPSLLKHSLRRDIVGLDHGDHAIDLQGTEGLLHHDASGLGGQTASPGVRVQVVAQLHLGTVMFERLKATVADHAVGMPVLDGPEAPAQRSLVLDLHRDFALDILARLWADPPHHQRMQIDLGEGVEIVATQRAQPQPRGHDREDRRWRHRRHAYTT